MRPPPSRASATSNFGAKRASAAGAPSPQRSSRLPCSTSPCAAPASSHAHANSAIRFLSIGYPPVSRPILDHAAPPRQLVTRVPPACLPHSALSCPARLDRPLPMPTPDYRAMLAPAIEAARLGHAECGIPIRAALFASDGTLLGRGHNRRVQEDDPSVHGETDAFRKAGRQRSYRDTIMVTTLSPCWYCSGLVKQFGIGTVVMGESVNFQG